MVLTSFRLLGQGNPDLQAAHSPDSALIALLAADDIVNCTHAACPNTYLNTLKILEPKSQCQHLLDSFSSPFYDDFLASSFSPPPCILDSLLDIS